MKRSLIMNKAMVILSALGVMAVIGSALAFKANKAYLGDLRCSTFTTTVTTLTHNPSLCTAKTYSLTNSPNGTIRFCAVSKDLMEICVTKRVIFNQ
jgi:hypothetical protein